MRVRDPNEQRHDDRRRGGVHDHERGYRRDHRSRLVDEEQRDVGNPRKHKRDHREANIHAVGIAKEKKVAIVFDSVDDAISA